MAEIKKERTVGKTTDNRRTAGGTVRTAGDTIRTAGDKARTAGDKVK